MKNMEKCALRQKYRIIKQKAMTVYNNNSYHSKLNDKLIQILRTKHKQCTSLLIGSYIPKPILQIIPPFINQLSLSQNERIKINYAYPYFNSKQRNMQFYEHSYHDRYRVGAFGIKVCDDVRQKEKVNHKIDVCLVPLVCFNQDRQRIGEGGGYYDRFIKQSRQKSKNDKPLHFRDTIFVGIGLQALKIVQNQRKQKFDQWDQPLDYIITQSKIY